MAQGLFRICTFVLTSHSGQQLSEQKARSSCLISSSVVIMLTTIHKSKVSLF